MTTQHTPGPWAISAAMYGVGNLKVHGVEFTRDGITQPIANCGWDDKGEAEANARLIAAAPDLLAALRLCERALEERDAEAEEHAAKAARAAIAKAKGAA